MPGGNSMGPVPSIGGRGRKPGGIGGGASPNGGAGGIIKGGIGGILFTFGLSMIAFVVWATCVDQCNEV